MSRTTPFSRVKKDLEEQDIYFSLIERFGKSEDQIPERLRDTLEVPLVLGW